MNVYGFDGVIYGGNCEKDFFKFCLKRNKALLKYVPKQRFKSSSDKKLKEQFYEYLKEIKDVDKEIELFWNTHRNYMNTWFPDWRKKDDVMITEAPEFLVAPIAKEMEFALSATMVDKNTGKITGEVCRGKEKVKRYRAVCKKNPLVRAFLSSVADEPLASARQGDGSVVLDD